MESKVCFLKNLIYSANVGNGQTKSIPYNNFILCIGQSLNIKSHMIGDIRV